MRKLKRSILLVLLSSLIAAGCTAQTKRLSPDEGSEIEMGTNITSQDFRSVAHRMARSLVIMPQIQNAVTPPKVAFIAMDNRSNDYIDTEAFLGKMRTELIKNSGGKIVFLDRAILRQIEKENKYKSAGSMTASSQKTPLGADFFLTGTIEAMDRVAGRGHTNYTRLSFRLTDAANSAIVWEDDYEIKKHSTLGMWN